MFFNVRKLRIHIIITSNTNCNGLSNLDSGIVTLSELTNSYFLHHYRKHNLNVEFPFAIDLYDPMFDSLHSEGPINPVK